MKHHFLVEAFVGWIFVLAVIVAGVHYVCAAGKPNQPNEDRFGSWSGGGTTMINGTAYPVIGCAVVSHCPNPSCPNGGALLSIHDPSIPSACTCPVCGLSFVVSPKMLAHTVQNLCNGSATTTMSLQYSTAGTTGSLAGSATTN